MAAADMILDLMFIALTVVATAFPLTYLVLPWRSTPQGRAIMHFAIGMSILLNLTILLAFWQPHSFWVLWWIQFVPLTYVLWAAAFRTFVLMRDIRNHWTPPPQETVGTDFAGHPQAEKEPPAHRA